MPTNNTGKNMNDVTVKKPTTLGPPVRKQATPKVVEYRPEEWKLISRIAEDHSRRVATTEAMMVPPNKGIIVRDTVCVDGQCTVSTLHILGVHLGTIKDGENKGGFCIVGGSQ